MKFPPSAKGAAFGDSVEDMASHIYIIQDGRNSKIGITSNLKKRIDTYKTHNPNFLLFRAFETDGANAKRIERAIIAAFKDEAVGEGKEWFAVAPETVERCVLAFMPSDAEAHPPSAHEIPLTGEARRTLTELRAALDTAGSEAGNDEAYRLWKLRAEWNGQFGNAPAKVGSAGAKKAKAETDDLDARVSVRHDAIRAGKNRLAELFADSARLGLPSHRVPEGTVRTGSLGVDWQYCDPVSDSVRKIVREGLRLPLDDHTERHFHLSRLASGSWAAVCTARVSQPWLPQLNDAEAWARMASVANDLGWICSTHDDWSWHDPGRTGLILWQPKTPVRTLLEQWDGSFRKWVVERRKALLMEAKGHKDFAKVIDDLSGDETFPLAVRDWDELVETYFDRYWEFEMPDRFRTAYRVLWEKWAGC